MLHFLIAALLLIHADDPNNFVEKRDRSETIRANLAVQKLPNLEGAWYYAGPFSNRDKAAFENVLPAEKDVQLKQSFVGKRGEKFGWNEMPTMKIGAIVNLASLFPKHRDDIAVVLLHEFDSTEAFTLPLALGSDDTLTVTFNGKEVFSADYSRPAEPNQDFVDLKVKQGHNQLLIKVCQYSGQYEVWVSPEIPKVMPKTIAKQIDRRFPLRESRSAVTNSVGREAEHYDVTTLPVPEGCVLEVGGLAFRPDGSLLACTRRGEIWKIDNPSSQSLDDVKFSLYASGLHEPLGMHVESNTKLKVVQRPEYSELTDTDNDGVIDQFHSISEAWGVSGDYHEYAFGPAIDKDGNAFITLNVGFAGGHQAKAAWRGWCLKIAPDGTMEPWAYGLRSPNGVAFSPEGDLFYCDNQGEWVASNKMHHIQRGDFYGHQASLKWLKDSPFAKTKSENVASGMWYDGTQARSRQKKFPELTPPCIWFPYGKMGQSASEPCWDTTNGKFGPFAGQCFVGDQTRSMVMRVALEKVDGEYQGACFPFRNGLQCGVNRITFGPDGSMYVGQTNRGWGSIGGKPFGLQRIAYNGELPFEIHSIELKPEGFALHLTQPIADGPRPEAFNVKSWTYVYHSQYGCPETDVRVEAVEAAELSDDGQTITITVPKLQRGRVYEIDVRELVNAQGESLVHPVGYYTLNRLAK